MPDVISAAKSIGVLVVAYIGSRGSVWGGGCLQPMLFYPMKFAWSFFSKLSGLNFVRYDLFLILILIYYLGGATRMYQNLTSRLKSFFLRQLMNTDTI